MNGFGLGRFGFWFEVFFFVVIHSVMTSDQDRDHDYTLKIPITISYFIFISLESNYDYDGYQHITVLPQ